MSENTLAIEQVLARMAEHPLRIAALTEGLTPAQLRQRPEPKEWSANEILAHLRACADVWGGYMRKILAEDRPTIRALSPRTYIHKTDYPELEYAPSFQAFTTQREELLALLKPLPPEAWSRAASVKMVGKVMDRTVLDYAERLILHEGGHLYQIEATANTVRK